MDNENKPGTRKEIHLLLDSPFSSHASVEKPTSSHEEEDQEELNEMPVRKKASQEFSMVRKELGKRNP